MNESDEPLSGDFDVVVYVTRREGPNLGGGFELNQTYRFDSDYVIRVEADKCGPGYWEQTESSTCEQFVHDFPDGLPVGRYDVWVLWHAPCSAWEELGLATCSDPSVVVSKFHATVNSPVLSPDHPEFEGGAPPGRDWLYGENEATWGW